MGSCFRRNIASTPRELRACWGRTTNVGIQIGIDIITEFDGGITSVEHGCRISCIAGKGAIDYCDCQLYGIIYARRYCGICGIGKYIATQRLTIKIYSIIWINGDGRPCL